MKLHFIERPQFQLPLLRSDSISQLYSQGAHFLDVRTADEVAAGTVPGSSHVALQELPVRMAELASLKNEPLVLFCRSGARSDSAAVFLRSQGFLHAWNAGGYEDIMAIINDASPPD